MLSSREEHNHALHTTTTIDEENTSLTASGRRRQQLRSPPPPSVSERSTSPSLPRKHRHHHYEQLQPLQATTTSISAATTTATDNSNKMRDMRKAYQSTPNLVKMENDEYEFLAFVPNPNSGSPSASTTKARRHTTLSTSTSFTALSTLNRSMKRSKSELILLSPEFRTKLMNEQKERDPLFYYHVKKTIGTGSMGSVALVKKRSQTVGGSARKNVREAVRTHKRKQKCFELPFGIGGLFRLCIDAELKVEDADLAPKKGKSRGGKNALLSIETWLGSSQGSSDVSSSDSSDSLSSYPQKQTKGQRKLFPSTDDSTDRKSVV